MRTTADGRERREPVAICRLKRVAADCKQDIPADVAVAGSAKEEWPPRRRIGAGPASLTVARDLSRAPLGYEVVTTTAMPAPAA
ncbi:MAG: hypothetical protein IPJ27_19765 [Candidatus Accumulibacter sp.]|uniref:Uncharacterized protein n=1 Tax=Candidatus Accumulibacter proximus TaxID=2954385 RepID=A0A935Q235_9PROT|nr:hypothetical protein [Candidatus Accumulibacter proximus]